MVHVLYHLKILIWNIFGVDCDVNGESILFKNDCDKLLHVPHCPGSHTTPQISKPTVNFININIETSENGCDSCKCGLGYDINEINNGFDCECWFIKIAYNYGYNYQLYYFDHEQPLLQLQKQWNLII